MSTAGSKCVKPNGEKPDEFEELVAKTFMDIEASSDLRANLKELHFVGAKELDVGSKKVVLIQVPYPQQKLYHKIHSRLVRLVSNSIQ